MISRPPAKAPVLTRWPIIVRDWLGSDTLRGMSGDAEMLFMRMCLDQWEHGAARADIEHWRGAHAHRMRDFSGAYASALRMFAVTDAGLVNERVARDREEQMSLVSMRAEMGHKAASARWEGRKDAGRMRSASRRKGSACGPNHSASASAPESSSSESLIPISLQTPEFRRALEDYQKSRREQGHKALGEVGMKRLLTKLERWGLERAIAALADSAANGYQGVFEPKNGKHSGPDAFQQARDFFNGTGGGL